MSFAAFVEVYREERGARIKESTLSMKDNCAEIYDVADMARKLKGERIKDYVKNQVKGITLSDVIGTAIGIVGL